jgi:hypothetical protein
MIDRPQTQRALVDLTTWTKLIPEDHILKRMERKESADQLTFS